MIAREFQVEVKDTAVEADPAGQKFIRYRTQGSTDFFRVRIYLDGPQLPFVRVATYVLPPDQFPDSVQRVERSPRNPNCEFIIWTWGVFDVGVTLQDAEGRVYDLTHRLTYDRDVKTEGIRFKSEPGDPGEPARPQMRVSSSNA
jgi:hypothetical protein